MSCEEIFLEKLQKNGFQADLTSLNIPGLCENCRGQKTRSITVNILNQPAPLG